MNESRAIDVIQLGARMHYAVPVFFHEKHLLGQLFTDIWIPNSGISSFINKIPISSIKKLSNRFRSEIPSDLVTSFFSLGLSYSEALRKNRHNRELETGVFLEYSRSFQQKVMQSGSLHSSYIYAFNTVAKDIFSHSESKSKTKILEQTLIPRKTEFDLLQSEFSFYGIDYQKGEKSLAYEQLELDENQLADIILCGSNFVKQSLIDLNISSDKIKVVPYGYTNPNSIQVEPKSLGKQLSLLFVGNGGIRKGLRYLFEAASTLPNVKFTIAGTLEKEITLQDIPKNVRLLGSVERAKMPELYASHDILLLPSICEGSATVSYEALSYGLPVICTPNSGTVIEHEKDGLLIPIRSSDAIVKTIEQFLTKPELLRKMSKEAFITAQKYDANQYGKRLLKAIYED